jgi:hypothetical protein
MGVYDMPSAPTQPKSQPLSEPLVATVPQAAALVGRSPRVLRRWAAEWGGAFSPGEGPDGIPRYHAVQLRIMSRALVDKRYTLEKAAREWEQRRELLTVE